MRFLKCVVANSKDFLFLHPFHNAAKIREFFKTAEFDKKV